MEDKPKLKIPLESFRKLFAYVDLVDTEVTGFFDVTWNQEEKYFRVGEVYLIEQTAGGADVEMDEEAIANFNLEFAQKPGVTQLPQGWWHSHVNMGVFWSGTDNETIDKDFTNDSFTVSLVVNKSREMKACVVIRQPLPEDHLQVQLGIAKQVHRIEDIPVVIEFDYQRIPNTLQTEVEQKVKTRKYVAPSTGGGAGKFHNYWGRGQAHKAVYTYTLPKDRSKAARQILAHGLVREYDKTFQSWVYKNQKTGCVWHDPWQNTYGLPILKQEDYEDKKIILPKGHDSGRCKQCGEMAPDHASDCETGWVEYLEENMPNGD